MQGVNVKGLMFVNGTDVAVLPENLSSLALKCLLISLKRVYSHQKYSEAITSKRKCYLNRPLIWFSGPASVTVG